MNPGPWNPSKGTRILIGVATLWMPLYMLLFLAFVGTSFFLAETPQAAHHMPRMFMFIFPLHCLTMLISMALIAVYIIHAVKSDRLTQEMRIVWILILFMGNMLAFPVYWWIYLRPGTEADAPRFT